MVGVLLVMLLVPLLARVDGFIPKGHTQHRPQAVMLAMRPSPGGPNPSTPERAGGLFEVLSQQIREAAPLLTFAAVFLGAGMMVDSIKKDQELIKKDLELVKIKVGAEVELVKIKVGAEVEGLQKDEAYNNLQVRSELERRILDFLTSTSTKDMRSRIMDELSDR